MLSREHAIADYDFQRNLIVPDRLTRARHAPYVELAESMLEIYRRGVGRTRGELHRDVHHTFARIEDCPLRRIEAFCKLLDDASTYDTDRSGRAAKLRLQVFRLAAAKHPLVQEPDTFFDHCETEVKQDIAARLGRTWRQIEGELFADILDFQNLISFEGYADAAALLARYNVAQIQVALFDALEMTIRARNDFKLILRRAKLARLMHTIHRVGPDEYEIHLDGPASLLRSTRRYGTSMAKFLPSLLACRDWSLHALVRARRGGWTLALNLSAADGIRSSQPVPDEFDSALEETFAARWGTEPREGWTLHRETAVLHIDQKVFVPDFEFRHHDGRTAMMEIVGYWTPEYLEVKRQTLQQFAHHRILLAVAHSIQDAVPDLGMPRVIYKTSLKPRDVLHVLESNWSEPRATP